VPDGIRFDHEARHQQGASKTLRGRAVIPPQWGDAPKKGKSFLLLFFKKEVLPFFLPPLLSYSLAGFNVSPGSPPGVGECD
jgi:hypothetical protein